MKKYPDYGRQPAFRPDVTVGKRKRKLRRPGQRRKLWSKPQERAKVQRCECTMHYSCPLHR